MSQAIRMEQLNRLDTAGFVSLLGAVFEHSPWVAERVAGQRPFTSIDALHASMVAVIEAAGQEAQLRLIRAHPELAGKAAVLGELTQESHREQKGAGLDQCSPEELTSIQILNAQYQQKFSHPFIVAVRGHTRQSIIGLLRQRLANSPTQEQVECLQQIYRIGRLRLDDLLHHD
jgi:2-oxo-4-hydroxy-4-carboxy-5-ureidoimidazoline decarboxylase